MRKKPKEREREVRCSIREHIEAKGYWVWTIKAVYDIT